MLTMNSNRFQAGTAIESIVSYFCHAVANGDGGQAAAIVESLFSDASHFISKNYLFDRTKSDPPTTAFRKPPTAHMLTMNSNRFQAAATIESTLADDGDAVRNSDGSQAAAMRESRTADAGDAIGDGDGAQAAATIESRVADDGDAVRNSDGSQAAAMRECIIADTGYTVGNGNGAQACAILESMIADAGYSFWDSCLGATLY